MGKRHGQPLWFESQGYITMRNILVSYLGERTWMNTDQVLGAIKSGMDEAIIEYKNRKIHSKRIKPDGK